MSGLVAPPSGPNEWAHFYGDFPGTYNEQNKEYEYRHGWWEDNIVRIRLPFALRLSWNRINFVRDISVNWRIEEPINLVFEEIDRGNLAVFVYEFGGTVGLRKVRGGEEWSIHSWVAGIDLNPDTNQLGKDPTMNKDVVEIFETFGFSWGGRFARRDGMHFQFGRN